jgi:bifunctional DNA-binding transcriptional regulator/antitoxin component of YhaV-PrlF toxin-antitoxin module
MPELHRLPRDASMLYGIGRADASGRVAGHAIVEALGWQCGDRLEIVTTARAIVIRASPSGFFFVPRRPCIVIPVTARRHCGIKAGDSVLLAAAPEYGIVIVHTLSALDGMLAEYHATHSPAKAP